ncbi:hypothetical protein ACROYT_G025779 [Oculina patagonica]
MVLCCYPLHVAMNVWKEISSKYTLIRHGEGTSDCDLSSGDWAFVSFPETIIPHRTQHGDNEDIYVRFLGHGRFLKKIAVRYEEGHCDPSITFFKKIKEGRETLCTIEVSPTSLSQKQINPPLNRQFTSQDVPPDLASLFEQRTDVITSEQIREIKDDVGTCWHDLGIELQIEPKAKVDDLQQDCNENKERARKVLEMWLDQKGTDATVGRLALGLFTIKRRSIAEKLLALGNSRDTQGKTNPTKNLKESNDGQPQLPNPGNDDRRRETLERAAKYKHKGFRTGGDKIDAETCSSDKIMFCSHCNDMKQGRVAAGDM